MAAATKWYQLNGQDYATSWQSALITLIMLFVLGFFMVKTVQGSPAKPIYIDASNLTVSEKQSLQQVADAIGQVQFFGANLHSIHDKVLSLSWVEDAQVSRDWHHGVMISVTPRKAVANFGSRELVDANAVVFTPANTSDLMNADLVTLHGAAEDAKDIMYKLHDINERFVPLGLMAQDLILTPRKTWVIRFQNGLRVVVDHENTDQKLYNLSVILKQRFMQDIGRMQSIDLRYKNGFSIAWKTEAIVQTPASTASQ